MELNQGTPPEIYRSIRNRPSGLKTKNVQIPLSFPFHEN